MVNNLHPYHQITRSLCLKVTSGYQPPHNHYTCMQANSHSKTPRHAVPAYPFSGSTNAYLLSALSATGKKHARAVNVTVSIKHVQHIKATTSHVSDRRSWRERGTHIWLHPCFHANLWPFSKPQHAKLRRWQHCSITYHNIAALEMTGWAREWLRWWDYPGRFFSIDNARPRKREGIISLWHSYQPT